MSMIRNNLNSRILIQLKGGKSIDLLEKSTVEITDDDLLSSHLQNLIQRGLVIEEKETKKEIEKEVKDKIDEGLNKEKESKENPKKENEVNQDLSKEIKVKSEVDEKSEQKKSSNAKKGK